MMNETCVLDSKACPEGLIAKSAKRMRAKDAKKVFHASRLLLFELFSYNLQNANRRGHREIHAEILC